MKSLSILALLMSGSVVFASEPSFVVVNKCDAAPKFTVVSKIAPEVKSVASVLVDPDHSCPNCKREQKTVNRFVGTTHSHLCSSCGTEWFHKDPGIAAAPQTPLKSIGAVQSSSGCVGGNCPTGYSQPSRGWRPGAILFGR